MSDTTPYRSSASVRGDSLGLAVRAELTKLLTVRGWVVGVALSGIVTILIGLMVASGSSGGCGSGCSIPIGPTGEAVSDSFTFVHRPLDGDGTLTARVVSLDDSGSAPDRPAGLQPWAKAGLIVKDGTEQGSTYVAVMVTGDHGVRMQHDYVNDTGGDTSVAAGSSQWLRLERSGDTITTYASADGSDWSTVGTVQHAGLPEVAEVGLFVASPDFLVVEHQIGGTSSFTGPTAATGTFDNVELEGAAGADDWTVTTLGDDWSSDSELADGTFRVTGSGDIAPAAGGQALGSSLPLELTLVGVFAGLIVIVVPATSFMTAEYRRSLILTTLAASPRRGRVLAAKAIVIGAATFVVGLVAALLAALIGTRQLRAGGATVYPTDTLTDVRVVVGTAALLAVAAVLALAVGTLLRRGAGAVVTVIVALVLPYILAVSSVLPAGPAEWLLRVTPAAGFAIQQSLHEYAHVANEYSPANGYFPLAPLAGFGVLCAWTVLAVAAAAVALQRRDA